MILLKKLRWQVVRHGQWIPIQIIRGTNNGPLDRIQLSTVEFPTQQIALYFNPNRIHPCWIDSTRRTPSRVIFRHVRPWMTQMSLVAFRIIQQTVELQKNSDYRDPGTISRTGSCRSMFKCRLSAGPNNVTRSDSIDVSWPGTRLF